MVGLRTKSSNNKTLLENLYYNLRVSWGLQRKWLVLYFILENYGHTGTIPIMQCPWLRSLEACFFFPISDLCSPLFWWNCLLTRVSQAERPWFTSRTLALTVGLKGRVLSCKTPRFRVLQSSTSPLGRLRPLQPLYPQVNMSQKNDFMG